MFDFISTKIPGLKIIQSRLATDERGSFAKTFHRSTFLSNGLTGDFSETYYSVSKRHVIRGMHFQLPPHDHDKLVNCLSGRVLDVVLDLRVGSPTYGECCSIPLDQETPQGVYIPAGCAHGFLCVSENATLLYNVTTEYSPQHDTGIRWDSFGFDWGTDNITISERDRTLPSLWGFDSPFAFQG
jgi:dTDP-4-dehydrorhamnose 3,5-epimerase